MKGSDSESGLGVFMVKQQTSEGADWRERISTSPYNQLAKGTVSDKISLFDTTLRDGEQAPGIAMSQDDKIMLAKTIDELEVDTIEVGYAASGDIEKETISKIVDLGLKANICSLARCKKKDIDAVVESGAKNIHLFIATSDIHLKYKLEMSRDDVLDAAVKSVKYAKKNGLTVQFSCEDATRTDFDFLKKVYASAVEAGADSINVPDTVGIAMPKTMGYLISELKKSISVPIAVHCHNDLGLAVANSIAAAEAGAEQIHVCVNGIGERAGNASLEEVATCLYVNYGVKTVDLEKVSSVSRAVSRTTGYPIAYNKPIVGRNAFAHEAGIHVHGIMKNANTYEPFPPEMVGMNRIIAIGKHSGEHSVRSRLDLMKIEFPEELMPALMSSIKSLSVGEKEISDIELAAIAENTIWKGKTVDNVKLKEFVVFTGKNATPTATVTIDINGEKKTCANTGFGPVDAAFNAIRGAFNERIEIEEFRLEAITGGSDSLCEVTVMIKDTGNGGKVSVGKSVGLDIVDTSVDAIMEAINRGYAEGN